MRLSTALLPFLAFVLAAVISVAAARSAVAVVEDRSGEEVEQALLAQGQDWASVITDGLQVILEGEAPTEARRFRAMSIAGEIVDASRVIDDMSVAETAAIAPPAFGIEILRNDSGVSLIGLIPADTDREALNAEIAEIAGDAPVADFLEEAAYPVPEGWAEAVDYALDALESLPRSKISIAAGFVEITAITDSGAAKRRLETDLSRTVPEGVRLALTVTAPRPVITPFTVRFVLDDRGARFEACSAATEEGRDAIIAAASRAGLNARVACTIGLGVPSTTWGQAVAQAIDALAEIGGGTLTFSDADVVLTAAEGTDRTAFDQIIGELSNALPEVYALEAVLPEPPVAQPAGPPQFTATLSPEGAVQIRGRLPDLLMNATVETFAKARFGAQQVTMGTRVVEDLPQGWSVRVLAALEALSKLENGAVTVLPDSLSIRGTTGDQEASAEIARLMIEKLGQGAEFSIDVAYDEELDPTAGLPTPAECIARIEELTDGRKITFDPGSATLTGATQPVVAEIAESLKRCPDLHMEIAGYTDSQGRDEMNLDLSQERADAVLEAIRARRVPTSDFSAVGYGEADPIADNDSEEGREANRRIEFRLVDAPAPPAEGEDAAADQSDMPPGVRESLESLERAAAAAAQRDAEAEAAEDGEVPPAAQQGLEGSGD